MWGRKGKIDKAVTAEVAIAIKEQNHADAVIAYVDSQEAEVTDIVTRLETRQRRNNFGEALEQAMQRRATA